MLWATRIDGTDSRPSGAYSFSTDHLKIDIKHRAVKSSAATIFFQLLSFLVQLAGTMVLGRILSPSDFGLVAMATTFSLLFQNFGLSGFTEAIIHADDLRQEQVNVLFWINAILCVLLTFLFAAASPALAWFYREPRLTLVAAAISLSIVFSGLSTFHLALLKRKMQFGASSAILAWSKLASVGATIVLALWGLGYWALVVSVVSLPLFTAVLAWIFCRWRPDRPSFRSPNRRMLRYSFYTYGNFVLHYGSRNLDNLLVGKFLGVQPLGFYKKAYDLFALPTSQLLSPLANVALASLSRYSDETDKLKRYFFDAISIIAFVSMGISLVLTVSAADIILLLLGPAWGKTAEIFALFGPGIGFVLIYGTHGWLHLALGRAERWLRWGLFEFAVTAAFITVGIAFGLRAVALAWTCSYLILAGPSIWYAGRPIRLRFWAFYSCIWKYALAALGAGLLTRFSLASFGPVARAFSGLSVLLRIPVAFALSLAAYVAFVVLLHGNGRPISRFVGLTKEMIARRASPRA